MVEGEHTHLRMVLQGHMVPGRADAHANETVVRDAAGERSLLALGELIEPEQAK